ncbi:uncharacterized protein LOC111081943 isoform X3 [Drosophila obscura]|uniref:uncharacterized protein LOC111081943 isoform X3 n=1 Tax=Drosophila obscura TaxID=7282 RepID=UPI000BA1841F|nr:uncharacterized protein LOC111081943 isoform X3 [Drosophila obscura]
MFTDYFTMENEQSSNIKRFEFASEQPQPQEQTLTSEERIIAAFKKENNELHKQLDSLEKKFDVMAEALAGAVAMLKIGVKKYPKAPKCHFPIKSKVELEAMNNAICEELIEFYFYFVNFCWFLDNEGEQYFGNSAIVTKMFEKCARRGGPTGV